MEDVSHSGNVYYYGGYPGHAGKPIYGRLSWGGGALRFTPRGANEPLLVIDQSRMLGARRFEEGMTGARRIRLLIDARTEPDRMATLKFEMCGLLPKERKLARWLDVLGPAATIER